jgi:hypothetical protein
MNVEPRNRDDPLSPLQAYEALQKYGQQNGATRLMLLAHCAVPERVSPELINLIKVNFLPETGNDLSVDADVLFCPIFDSIGTDFYRMEPEVRRQCLTFLDSAYRGDQDRRTNQVARFLLRYLDKLETEPDARTDLVFSEFIDIQRWGAWAFLDPSRTARAMALALATSVSSPVATHFRLEGITGAVSIPLAGHQDLLAYARTLNAINSGTAGLSHELMEDLDEEAIEVEHVKLRPLREVLGERAFLGAARQDSEAQAPDAQMHRVWIASGMDVAPERDALLEIIGIINTEAGYERLSYEHAEYGTAPAALLQKLAVVDIVVGILGSSIGSPLLADFERQPDGEPYPSILAYELLKSLEASRKNGRPGVLIYEHQVSVAGKELEALQKFRNKVAPEYSFRTFSSISEFRLRIRADLQAWLLSQRESIGAVAPDDDSGAFSDFAVICSVSALPTAQEVLGILGEEGYSGEIVITSIEPEQARRALRRARNMMVLLSDAFDPRIMRLPEGTRFQAGRRNLSRDRLVVLRLEPCSVPSELENVEIRALNWAETPDDRRACIIAAAKDDPDPLHRLRYADRYDFFISSRGSVGEIAREVTDVLTEKGYKVFVQDYDFPLGASFVEGMREALKNSRDLIILFTSDYEQSPYTRKEFTSFEAQRAQSPEERHMIVLRCEDVPLRGLFADQPYQDLVGIHDGEERKRRIIAAVERQSQLARPPPRPFIGVPPRIASFTGRADELDRLDAILMGDKPAAVTEASVGRAAVLGMAGVGKTALAVEYAHRFRGLYAGVCWCPAETRTSLLSALANLAVTLGAATAEETDVEKSARAALLRLGELRATWLLVYDNVTAPDHIVDLLPSSGARVLITSRFSDWRDTADEVVLDVLLVEESRGTA